jgi:hypothetical protein
MHNIAASQRIKTRYGAPTPDDREKLITNVWKESKSENIVSTSDWLDANRDT